MSTVDTGDETELEREVLDAEQEHDDVHDHDEAHHPSDKKYIQIAIILAVITAVEVAASYVDLGPIFIPALLGMMVAKFLIVVGFFMHLRFDNKIFTWLFYTGLILAVGVYVVALLTFQFFNS